MADLPNQTSNVSVWDDLGGNAVGVTNNISTGLYEFHVVDDDGNDWLEQIATGTTVISGNVTTSWEAFSNAGRAYITTFGASFTGGTAETGFILLRNPVSSGRYVKIYRLTLAVTTNTTGKFRIYRHPTITTPGTALYVEEFGLHAPPPDNVALAYSTPTYSATGSTMAQFDVNAGGVGIVTLPLDLALILGEGEEILITLAQGSNNNAFSANLSWAEEDIPTP